MVFSRNPGKGKDLSSYQKRNKPPQISSSFVCWTLQEISNRIEEYAEQVHAISDNQFGFRSGRSTTDAISAVCKIGHEAMSGTRWLCGAKEYCAVITLDVKNAFNTARWTNITNVLRIIKTAKYLPNIVQSYFSDGVLFYDISDGPKQCNVTSGVPKTSVLGPLLWNIMYDGILRIRKPK